jgi:hypothetical protein
VKWRTTKKQDEKIRTMITGDYHDGHDRTGVPNAQPPRFPFVRLWLKPQSLKPKPALAGCFQQKSKVGLPPF